MPKRIKLVELPEDLSDEYKDIPPLVFSAMINWIRFADEPGHFMSCLLRNDLAGSCAYADSESMKALKSIVTFLQSKIPGCWGSDKAVEKWREHGGLEGFTW